MVTIGAAISATDRLLGNAWESWTRAKGCGLLVVFHLTTQGVQCVERVPSCCVASALFLVFVAKHTRDHGGWLKTLYLCCAIPACEVLPMAGYLGHLASTLLYSSGRMICYVGSDRFEVF